MLLIACPHCGPRASAEFTHRGEAPDRPVVSGVAPEEWRRYLYTKENLSGAVTEEWFHVSGCRRFLVVERDSLTNEVRSVRDRSDS